jgi:hypothetical protein
VWIAWASQVGRLTGLFVVASKLLFGENSTTEFCLAVVYNVYI